MEHWVTKVQLIRDNWRNIGKCSSIYLDLPLDLLVIKFAKLAELLSKYKVVLGTFGAILVVRNFM